MSSHDSKRAEFERAQLERAALEHAELDGELGSVSRDAFDELARARPLPHPRVLEAIRADVTSSETEASGSPRRALAPGSLSRSSLSGSTLSRNGRLALSGVLLFGGLSLTSFGKMLEHGMLLVTALALAGLVLGSWLLSGFVPGPHPRLGLGPRRGCGGGKIFAVLLGYAVFWDHFSDWDALFET